MWLWLKWLLLVEHNLRQIFSMSVRVIMAEEWGAADDAAPVVVAPEVQDIKLFGKWSTDDVQVSDISLTVSVLLVHTIHLPLESDCL